MHPCSSLLCWRYLKLLTTAENCKWNWSRRGVFSWFFPGFMNSDWDELVSVKTWVDGNRKQDKKSINYFSQWHREIMCQATSVKTKLYLILQPGTYIQILQMKAAFSNIALFLKTVTIFKSICLIRAGQYDNKKRFMIWALWRSAFLVRSSYHESVTCKFN